MACKRSIFLLAVLSLLGLVVCGRTVSVNTTSDHQHYFLNDLGVNVKARTLLFDVTSTQDAIIRLAELQSMSGSFCDVIIGSVSNTAIAVRESCGTCGSYIMAGGTFLNSSSFTSLWLDWSDDLVLKMGEGTVLGESQLFSYNLISPFEINYVTATSYYGHTGRWNFVIDSPPYCTYPEADGSTVFAIAEDWPINGAFTTLSATDDEGDIVTFHLIGQQINQFQINGSDLILKEKLDFEYGRFIAVSVVASDGRHNVTCAFSLNVTDVNDEVPQLTSGPVRSLPEELPVGSDVRNLFLAHDKDAGDALKFSLHGNHRTYFSINETSGEITVSSRMDRDAGLSHLDDLILRVQDEAMHVAELSLDLTLYDVNDNAPRFDSDAYEIIVTSSRSSNVTRLLSFNVTDDDEGDNANVTLTLLTTSLPVWLTGTEVHGNVTELLQMTSNLRQQNNLMMSVYPLAVEAKDGATVGNKLSAVAVINLRVQLTNDHSPIWLYPTPDGSGRLPGLIVGEDTAAGTVLMTFNATDDDLGYFGDVTYHITSAVTDNGGNATDTFFLHEITGELKTTNILDCDLATGGTHYFLLTLQARDLGSRFCEITLNITLTDVNDNSPSFSHPFYNLQLNCDVTSGTTIASLTSTDNDVTWSLTYEFDVGGLIVDDFVLDSLTGDISLTADVRAMTLEGSARARALSVVVRDGGTPDRTASTVVIIQIKQCSNTTSSSDDLQSLQYSNEILTLTTGLLAGACLLTAVLLIVMKAKLGMLQNIVRAVPTPHNSNERKCLV